MATVTHDSDTGKGELVPIRAEAMFAHSLAIHRRIEDLYPRVEERAAYFRRIMRADTSLPRPPGVCPGVVADPIVCALAMKAATTKRAVFALCDLGDGDNAFALTRVLLENACLMEWLIRGEGRSRLDAYIAFTSLVHERVVAISQRFRARFSAAGGPVTTKSDPYHSAIAKHMFGDTTSERPTWKFSRGKYKGSPISVKQMFAEIADEDLSFEHQVLYGALGSDIVHSGPFSLARTVSALRGRETFVLEPFPVREYCAIALAVSNMAMLLALDALNQYAGLGLNDLLASIKADAVKKFDVESDNADSQQMSKVDGTAAG